MKTALIIAISISFILYGCGTRIYMSPFKIELPNWMLLAGWLSIGMGIVLLILHAHSQGYEKGLKEGSNIVIEILKEMQEGKK